MKKTFAQLKDHYYWEAMLVDAYKTIDCFKECQEAKPFKAATFYRLAKPQFSWHTVSIDLVGPLLPSCANKKYIIVAVDHLTKWVKAKVIRDLGALTTTKFIFEHIIQ